MEMECPIEMARLMTYPGRTKMLKPLDHYQRDSTLIQIDEQFDLA